jgi:Ty3 transposon capsid-like protein
MSAPATTIHNEQALAEYIANAINVAIAPVQEQVQRLKNMNDVLQDQNEKLHEELHQYRERIDELEAKPTSTGGAPKIAKPTKFIGGKDSINVETFLAQVSLYLTQYPNATQQQHLSLMLSYLKGNAGKWAEPYVKKKAAGELDFQDFLEEFSRMFKDENKEAKAIRELETLKQGSSSVPEYVASFKQKSVFTNFSDYDLRLKLRSGLQTRIKEQLAHVALKDKNTFNKLVERAVEIGQNFEELDAEKK